MKNHSEMHIVEGLSCECGHCKHEQSKSKFKKNKIFILQYFFEINRIIFSTLSLIFGLVLNSNFKIIFFILSAIISASDLILGFFKNIIRLRIFNENTLMLVASITAFVLGDYFEGAFIVLLFYIGEFLETVATDNSKKKIADLSGLKSRVAHLISKEGIIDVLPEDVKVGSLLEVKIGESVPIDGVLLGLPCEFDMKAITGESKILSLENGQEVYSGAINVGNPIVIKTTKTYKNSTVEHIISMVEGALTKKSKSQKFIDKFAKLYTPIIFALTIFIATIPPLLDQMSFTKWIYKALSFLVISCPCALIISIPLSFFIAIGTLAKNGVLVKGSYYLEALSNIKTVAFDKTGTITQGNFKIDKIITYNGYTSSKALLLASCLEKYSNHPIAKAFTDKPTFPCDNVEEIQGKGIMGYINGKKVAIGNQKFINDLGVNIEQNFSETVLYLTVENMLVGEIYLVDSIKENASAVIKNLNKLGISKSYILSGDNDITANKVAEEVKVDKVYSKLLPNEKAEKLREIKRTSNGLIMYVGDGINDSPSLAIADVGVAMGTLGSDIAKNTADIVIMDDNLDKIIISFIHAKKIKRTVIQNITGSLGVKFSIMILSILISLPVWVAMLADVGVMLLAILNSLRLGRLKI